MSNCVICHKEISSIDEFGSIVFPKCITCWLDSGDESPILDERMERLTTKAKDMIAKVVTCSNCNGTGHVTLHKKGADLDAVCRKCAGIGKRIGEICSNCDAYGKIEHVCSCEHCDIEHEECIACNGVGVEFVPCQSRLPFVPESVKTFWVAA